MWMKKIINFTKPECVKHLHDQNKQLRSEFIVLIEGSNATVNGWLFCQ